MNTTNVPQRNKTNGTKVTMPACHNEEGAAQTKYGGQVAVCDDSNGCCIFQAELDIEGRNAKWEFANPTAYDGGDATASACAVTLTPDSFMACPSVFTGSISRHSNGHVVFTSDISTNAEDPYYPTIPFKTAYHLQEGSNQETYPKCCLTMQGVVADFCAPLTIKEAKFCPTNKVLVDHPLNTVRYTAATVAASLLVAIGFCCYRKGRGQRGNQSVSAAPADLSYHPI